MNGHFHERGMELIQEFVGFFLHLDQHLTQLVRDYGTGIYIILFLIIFAETGLVVTPFLPGDSLLFAAGALAANGSMNVLLLMALLVVAAIAGDSVNYAIGSQVGTRVFKPDARILRTEYLERTQAFYEKYGGKTIIIARFIPIVRTYAPFVAGAARMHYARFITYNVVGGIVWITLFLLAGFFFGNIPVVQENFGIVILAIIGVSVLPGIWEYVKHRRAPRPAR